jgi:hypothetical protein
MTDSNYTDITFVIDKSGSMAPLISDTISGYNAFLDDQKKIAGKCRVSLIQFNQFSETTYLDRDIAFAPYLNEKNYVPNGWTALYDALADAIKAAGRRFAAMPEHQRPGKVLFVVITDGQENSSTRYTFFSLKNLIELQQGMYNWNFTFLGSDLDAVKDAKNLGIQWSYTYNNTSIGTAAVYTAMSRNISSYRKGADGTYSCSVTPLQVENDLIKNK